MDAESFRSDDAIAGAHAGTPRNGNIIHMFMILTEHSERETFTISSGGAPAHLSVFRTPRTQHKDIVLLPSFLFVSVLP